MGLTNAASATAGPSTSSAATPAPPSAARLLPLALLTLALVLAGDDLGAAGLLSAPPTEALAVRSASGEPSASPWLCASATEMTVGKWSSSEDGGGAKGDHADRFLPAGCRLVEPGFDADGSLCAQLAALRIDALVFLGDSLAANLMLDLREGFFGEMSTEERPFGRVSCWASRKANFMSSGRGPCHDSDVCGGALRISWMDAARPDNQSESPFPGTPAYPGVMRTNAYNFLSIHYLAHPLPGMDPGGDLKHVLRFLRERSAKFPFVVVLGPAGVSRGADGRTPWDISMSAVQDLDAALRNASRDEGVSYLDALAAQRPGQHCKPS